MTVTEALRDIARRLAAAGILDPARDARHLLAHALTLDPDRLLLHAGDILTPDQSAALSPLVEARLAHQPVAQIIGHRLFWGRRFEVTPDVLDPRPETETLIALALQAPFTRLLDLGTGSGAILVTLLAESTGAGGLGTDISPAALAVAHRNAGRHAPRARFAQADWFDGVTGQFDLIVSNPPYIAADEMASLSADVREWEPHLALTPGGDGLEPYRRITAALRHHLLPRGRALVEIGPTQGPSVARLFSDAGLTDVWVHPDLDGRDRVVAGRAPADFGL